MWVYVRYSLDEYELPEAIADTAKELASIVGTTPNVISSSIYHGHRRYGKIWIGDNEDDLD